MEVFLQPVFALYILTARSTLVLYKPTVKFQSPVT